MTAKDSGTSADALQRSIEGTVFNSTLRKNVGEGVLDYEVYLNTNELLALQTPFAALSAPDELLFQVVHQTQELWMKQLTFEAVNLVRAMDGAKFPAIVATLHRMLVIARGLGDQIRILQTMPPDVFQVVRRQLGNGSGLESPGYNRFNVASEGLRAAFGRWCARIGIRPIDIYQDPQAHAESHRLAEALLDLDEAVQSWLVTHYMLVRRTIGVAKSVKALDGFPTVLLASRMTRPLFPELWDIRVEMTETWNRAGGFQPGEARTTNGGGPPTHPSGTMSVGVTQSVSGTHPAVADDSEPEGMPGPSSSRAG